MFNGVDNPSFRLSDRALIHGRNVLVASVVSLILAYVPGVNLDQLNFFGLHPPDMNGGYAWALLALISGYFWTRFLVDCFVEEAHTPWVYMKNGRGGVRNANEELKRQEGLHGSYESTEQKRIANQATGGSWSFTSNEGAVRDAYDQTKHVLAMYRRTRKLALRALLLDIVPPLIIGGWGVVVAVIQAPWRDLWCAVAN